MTKIVKKASTLLSNSNKTTKTTAAKTAMAKKKAQAKKVQAKKVVAKKKVSRRKTAEEKLNTAVAKMSPDNLKPVKMTTSDFLSYLASSLEKGTVNYGTQKGHIGVLPRKPQELAGTIKYLKRQATILNK